MKKKQKITSTNKGQFFGLLKRAARTPDPTSPEKSDALPVADYSDTQIHSHSSANVVSRRGGKSH